MNRVKQAIGKKFGYDIQDDEDDSPYDSVARPGAQLMDDDSYAGDDDDAGAPLRPQMTPQALPPVAANQPQMPTQSTPARPDLMADYGKQEAAARDIRSDALSKNSDVNIYRALGQIAGAAGSAPDQGGVYDSLIKQNDERAKIATDDLGKRAAVMKAIQQNQLRQDAIDRQDKYHQDSMANQAKYRDALIDLRQQGVDNSKDKGEVKTTNDQLKAFTQATKDMENFRGNRAASQASQDMYSADKALNIVKGKDPNSLTTQDLALLSGELSKIATGGVPTEHGIQHLMPQNLETKLSEIQNFLSSKPTPAEAGPYIRKNMEYLEQMKNASKGVVDSYRRNVLGGYEGRITDDQYSRISGRYGIGQDDAKTDVVQKSPEMAGSSSFPRMVSNGTHKATVSNQQEADEAAKEGFR